MNSLKRLLLLPSALLLVAALAPEAFGCSCPSQGPFLTVAPQSALVVRGRVLRHTGGDAATRQPATEMEVEVLEVFAGELSQKVITVSGDNGNQCRPYVDGFAVGSEWVLALGPSVRDERVARLSYLMNAPDKGDYAISNCGTYWLEVKDGRVAGHINPTPDGSEEEARPESQELSLEELRGHFKAAKKKKPND